MAQPLRVRTTDSRHDPPIAPNLLDRKFTAAAPNRVWLADITQRRFCGVKVQRRVPVVRRNRPQLRLKEDGLVELHDAGDEARCPGDGASRNSVGGCAARRSAVPQRFERCANNPRRVWPAPTVAGASRSSRPGPNLWLYHLNRNPSENWALLWSRPSEPAVVERTLQSKSCKSSSLSNRS
jgi:transposase InsO family protein